MFIRCIFLIMIFTSILCAAPVDLTNLEGKIINATIISANETEVIVKRTSDAKQFTIEIASLDAESVKIIDIWRNNQKSLPTEEKSHNFSHGSHSFDLKFKLPKYKYGFSSLAYEVIYSFDVDGKINPAHATEIFIREALVNDTVVFPLDCLIHNRAVRAKIENALTRTRDTGYLNLDEAIYRFYAARLAEERASSNDAPTGISTVAELVDLVRERKGAEPKFLMLEPEDLRDPETLVHDAVAFPEAVALANSALPLA